MEYYSQEEDSSEMTYDDFDNDFNSQSEVTEGLFSRYEKKSEEKKEKSEINKSACGCAPKPARLKGKSKRSKRALNAFIIFYLELYAKSSGKHVTCVAIEAGKKWCSMSEKEKEKYIQMAKSGKGYKKSGKKGKKDC